MVPSSLATNTATPFFVFATTGFRSSSPLAVTSSASHLAGPDTQASQFTSVPDPAILSCTHREWVRSVRRARRSGLAPGDSVWLGPVSGILKTPPSTEVKQLANPSSPFHRAPNAWAMVLRGLLPSAFQHIAGQCGPTGDL